jgi:hypothetical protein
MQKFSKRQGSGGFIKLLIAIIIALVVLSYFGFDLRSLIESPQTQANLKYFWGLLENIWFSYIWKGIGFIWNDIIVGYLWKNIVLIWQTASSNF